MTTVFDETEPPMPVPLIFTPITSTTCKFTQTSKGPSTYSAVTGVSGYRPEYHMKQLLITLNLGLTFAFASLIISSDTTGFNVFFVPDWKRAITKRSI